MNNSNSNNKNYLKNSPESYWISSTSQTDYPALNEDVQVDTAIIGGGMAGITTAFLLKRAGHKVALIEADRILQGTTGHTTAKITSQHNLIYDKIKKGMGVEMARQYAEANEAAIKFIASLVKEKNIDCDFYFKPAYVYTLLDEYVQKIKDEAETAASLGISAHYLEEIPLPFPVKAAVRFDNQAQFHPRKYLISLAHEIPGDGSYIFENTKALDINEGKSCTVITGNNKKITASNVVIASHYPFYDKPGLYFTRLYAERSYVLAIKAKEKFPEGMFISAEEPGRSLRSQPFGSEELIIITGEHHKTGHGPNTEEHYENLRGFAESTFNVLDIPYHWSTQDCMTLDGVPYVGNLTSDTSNIYVATGFGKWGMTNSTVSAMLLSDLIIKGKSPWKEVYSPSRFTPMASAANFITQNADVAARFIGGKLEIVPTDVDIPPETGKIVEVNGQRVGAYKDEKGTLHLVDTTCTHLGCELEWNSADKTWDCPCHGSRFTYEGDNVEGPALKPLKSVKHENTK